MNLYLDNSLWTICNDVYTIGYAVTNDGEYIHHESFCRYIDKNKDNLTDTLKSIEGQYSILIKGEGEDNYTIATDNSRVYNLFYTDTIITDNPTRLSRFKINTQAKEHILKLNSVLCDETLLDGVKQVRGGHLVSIRNGKGNDTCYNNILGGPKHDVTEKELSDCLISVFDKIGKTLKREDGSQRQVILSLSGGYDSRIIAERLINQLHHKNILLFTMGSINQGEQAIAMQVAEKLGVKCQTIDFNDCNLGYNLDTELSDAIHYVGALSSFCYIADYYTIKYLRQNGLIENDAIFMAGHIGDTLGGSTVRKWRIKSTDSFTTIAMKIMLSEYTGRSIFHKEARRHIKSIIKDYCKHETQAEQIAMQFSLENIASNGCGTESRYYTYFGYEMRLPLYSKELLSIASCMQRDNLFGDKPLYNQTLENSFFKKADIDFKKTLPSESLFLKQHIKNFIKAFLPRFYKTRYKNLGVDLLSENILTKDMKHRLIEKGDMKNQDDFLGYNEIMNKFYTTLLERK